MEDVGGKQHLAGTRLPRAFLPASRLIVSLCDYSGAWLRPYQMAGYQTIQVDLKHGQDVLVWAHPRRPWGVLAAPPCTHFSLAGSSTWARLSPADLELSKQIAIACHRLCLEAECFWALENPRGRLSALLGPPAMEFHPWHFGDPWQKRTALWGKFNPPQRSAVLPQSSLVGGRHRRYSRQPTLFGAMRDWGSAAGRGEVRRTNRSITPPGFAKAFLEANP